MSFPYTVIFVIAALAACESPPIVGSQPDALRADAIDVPVGGPESDAELRAGEVTISRISLVGSTRDVVLWDGPRTLDLLTLEAGAQTLIDGVSVPAGRYSMMRVVIDSAIVQVSMDGETLVFATEGTDVDADGTLLTPSWEPSGYKALFGPGGLVIDGNQRFLAVELDVGESFGHDATAADRWVMDPVLHALDVSMTAELVVDVWAATADLGDFTVFVRDEAGNVERRAHLAKVEPSIWTAPFPYLDPAEGPFEVDLEAPPNVSSFTTSLMLPYTVSPASGEVDRVMIRVTDVSY